jgi:uncharacterized membrane protein YGL010W
MTPVGWIFIFVGFGLLYPRKHFVIGPLLMLIGILL